MSLLTFKGGVHPPGYKEATEAKQVAEILPKPGSSMMFPMSQHIGAPCEPLVAVGDTVKIGQKIGDSGAFVSEPVHASVSGIVKEIKYQLVPGGSMSKTVVVEADGKNTEDDSINKPRDLFTLSNQDILAIVREAGIVGLGGAGFPTHVKLNPPPGSKIDTVIMNAAECEPYLTTDLRIMLEETDVLLEGFQIIMRLFPDARGIIGIESNKPLAIALLKEKCDKLPNISVSVLQTKYPQGAEKQLINACTGREVPSGKLPADIGCIVNNVDTIIAVQRAIMRGRPLMRRIVTLSGGAIANPGNYKVRLGMMFEDLIEAVGGFKTHPYKMIAGGPMMGVAMFSTAVPIVKTSSAFVCLTDKEAVLPPERGCIRCGRCIEHCPIGLRPQELNLNVLTADYDAFRKNNGLDCIECGTCSYVCPAKRHLTQSIRVIRKDMLSKKI